MPVRDGYLLAVGPGYEAIFHRAATYFDKILKGTKPADLPVEQPTRAANHPGVVVMARAACQMHAVKYHANDSDRISAR